MVAAFASRLQVAAICSLSLLYYQPARRTAALQEQLAVNEFCELGRVCSPLHANEARSLRRAAKPSITHTGRSGPNKRLPLNAAAAAPVEWRTWKKPSSRKARRSSLS